MIKGLIRSNLIQIRPSSIHGYGIFAKTYLKAGITLEECPVIPVTNTSLLVDFMFAFPRNDEKKNFNVTSSENVLSTGVGCLYNSSKTEQEKSVAWKSDLLRRIITFYTVKNVNKDEELLIYYGDSWWEERPDGITVRKKKEKIPKFKQ